MSGSGGAGTIPPTQGGALRTYGRVTAADGSRFWVRVDPDELGYNDSIYLTTLIQCCKLNWGESPFYGNWGIPARQSVLQQVPPDYAMSLMQQRFSPYFMALLLAKVPTSQLTYWDPATPTYQINVQFHSGARISTTVVPQALVDGYGQAVLDGHGYPTEVGTRIGKFAPG